MSFPCLSVSFRDPRKSHISRKLFDAPRNRSFASQYLKHIPYALVVEIVQGTFAIFLDLGFQLVDTAKLTLVAYAVQESNAKNVPIKIAVEIENVRFDRRFGFRLECRPYADVGDASAPRPVQKRCGRVHTELRHDAIVRF